MTFALVGDVAVNVLAPYFREAGLDVWLPSDSPEPPADAVIFDVQAQAEVLAREVPNFWDERMRQLALMPYSLDGIQALVAEAQFLACAAPKKILAVDADNTLWKGILSEDGKDALVSCETFQKGLVQLKEKGVVLVLLTKNDPTDSFFRADMPLQDGDFVLRQINWAPKAGNLIEACRALNLGLDTVVFVDDNPHERAQMQAHLPEVTVAPWGGWDAHPSEAQLLRRLEQYFFVKMGQTTEDALRAADYASPARTLKAQFADVGDYLTRLELKVAPSVATVADVPRLAQMAGKTNQFNATTLRRTAEAFEQLLADANTRVFVFRTSDKFGEQGIVCYVVVDLAARQVTDFVMSCRAMGRTLEYFAYAYVCQELSFEPSVAFTPTAKNAPFKAFWDAGMKGKTYYESL